MISQLRIELNNAIKEKEWAKAMILAENLDYYSRNNSNTNYKMVIQKKNEEQKNNLNTPIVKKLKK